MNKEKPNHKPELDKQVGKQNLLTSGIFISIGSFLIGYGIRGLIN